MSDISSNDLDKDFHDPFAAPKTDDIVLDAVTGKQVNTEGNRQKTGDQLIPKTTFAPIAAPGKLFGLKVNSAEELKDNMRLVYEDILRIFAASKTPIFLWGPPGSGKTRSVEAMGEDVDEHGVNYQVITVQPSTQDATVMHGLMTITEDPRTGAKIMHRSIPEIAEQVWKYYNDHDGLTVMFLDEMTTCIPAQQNAMLGLLTHGKFGDRDISPYTTFVLAANPPGTVQNVLPLSEAVINRGGHIPWFSSSDYWYDKWKTGFGNPAKEPDERTKDFIKGLIQSDPDVVFRFDPEEREEGEEGWDADNLCPYDQMESTERAFTEVAKVYKTMYNTFKDAPFDVRSLYVQEGIRAMVGNRWARNAARVEDNLSSRITIETSVEEVERNDITYMSSLDDITERLGDRLHRLRGKVMNLDSEIEMADKFVEGIYSGGDLSPSRYVAFWVWLATMPSEDRRRAVIPQSFTILDKAVKLYKNEYPMDLILPSFLSSDIKKEIRDAGKKHEEMSRRKHITPE